MTRAIEEVVEAPSATTAVATPSAASAVSEPLSLGAGVGGRRPAALLALQRAAGNRATGAALRRGGQCGGVARDASAPAAREAVERPRRAVGRVPDALAGAPQTPDGKVVLATIPISGSLLQRQGETEPAPMSAAPAPAAPALSSSVRDIATSKPSVEVGEGDARAIVADFVAAMARFPGARLIPFAGSDLVASAETPATDTDRTLATWPASGRVLARSSDDKKAGFEGGFIGSLQVCYDFCKGEVSIVGWLWIGGGVATKWFGKEQWWGAYWFVEGPLYGPVKKDWKFDCGTCDPACGGAGKEGGWEQGFGLGGFPFVVKPDQKVGVKDWGVELGALFHPKSLCDGDLEFILLIDLVQYVPVYGPAIKAALGQLTKWGEKLGIHLECGGGIDISGTLHLCKSVPGGGVGGITFDSALLCGGVYAGCNVGLSHNKSELPGGGKP